MKNWTAETTPLSCFAPTQFYSEVLGLSYIKKNSLSYSRFNMTIFILK